MANVFTTRLKTTLNAVINVVHVLWYILKLSLWFLWPFKRFSDVHGGPGFISPSQALLRIVQSNDPAGVRWALFWGASINVQDESGWTPIFKAHPALIPLLVQKGARLEHRSKIGYTPLLAAARWPPYRAGPTIEALIKAGADTLARTPEGLTWQNVRDQAEQRRAAEKATITHQATGFIKSRRIA